MAKRRGLGDTSKIETNSFIKGLNKDSDPSFVSDGMWTHARNAANNTFEGDLGTLSNETSNYLCATAGATMTGIKHVVGAIHLFSDKWIIFTAAYSSNLAFSSSNSEIGLFEESICRYRPIVQDSCFNFSKLNLITGASREAEDCSWKVYWADGLNPDRYINVGNPDTWLSDEYTWIGTTPNINYYINPTTGDKQLWSGVQWNIKCEADENCDICVPVNTIDCNNFRLARIVKTPCIKVTPGIGSGILPNGSYFATIAYSIKGQKVTDYFSNSNVQPIWHLDDLQGSLDIEIETDQENFDEFILVVVQNINQGAVAKQVGIYSTKINKIHIDQIKQELPSVPLEQLPLQTPVFEKSNQMAEVNDYLLRVGPTSKFDFNYQPLANLIQAEWVAVEYPEDYYIKGGSNTSYMRDEVYAFFIRWVYNTGDKSSAYHIPGRAPSTWTSPAGVTYNELDSSSIVDQNTLESNERIFEVYNTASITSIAPSTLDDGGVVVASGKMGYWESTEKYPDNKSEVWNSSSQCWTNTTDEQYDLCGKPIRHHKFPDSTCSNSGVVDHFRFDPQNGAKIRIMGVQFKNITIPKDNNGNDIPGIVGFEILRGSRQGNRSVIAKGIVNNFRPYNIQGNNLGTKKGLYPNYPFNTIQTPAFGGLANDPYIKVVDNDGDKVDVNVSDIPKNMLTFHSPDTMFRNPYLSMQELKLYGHLSGTSTHQFIEPNKHPKFKLVDNAAVLAMVLGGLVEAIISMIGKKTMDISGASYQKQLYPNINGAAGNVTTTAVWSPLLTLPFDFAKNIFTTGLSTYFSTGGFLLDAVNPGTGIGPASASIESIFNTYNSTVSSMNGGIYTAPSMSSELGKAQYLGAFSLPNLIYYFSEGAELTLNIIQAILPWRQYALQSIAHGYYNTFNKVNYQSPLRFNLDDKIYLRKSIQDFREFTDTTTGNTIKYKLNNLHRQDNVTLRTSRGVSKATDGPRLLNTDNSLVTLGTAVQSGVTGIDFEDKKSNEFNRNIASHYAGLKVRIDNQYGQLESIQQIPITPCEQKLENLSVQDITTSTWCTGIKEDGNPYQYQLRLSKVNLTPVFFGGDTYINRYTEKNNMMFFYDWLYDQPDGFEYNYLLRQMIPQPRFWVNSTKYEVSNLFNVSLLLNPALPGIGLLPTGFYNMDHGAYNSPLPFIPTSAPYDYLNDDPGTYPGQFGVKFSYFYLANSAIRDFFVESEVLVDFRTDGNEDWEKHYDRYSYTDLYTMFENRYDNLTRGNYHAYDYSLSVTNIFTQYYSQGTIQNRYYDPQVAELCYSYYPDRIIYSLPQQQESVKDSWFIYLANNYKEFKSQLSGAKSINKSGLFLTFKNDSPIMYQGVDTLQTDLGTKVTIGDGGLFSQPPQSVTNADKSYEYGSCQNSRAVISTPVGLFYPSQNQGKIFTYTGQLQEISQTGMKWWFGEFLPSKLLEDFPDYPHIDNPVGGVGIQATYDNDSGVLYFCKKDYKLKDEYIGRVTYNPFNNYFVLDKKTRLPLGSDLIFHDASWTISYDPKSRFWISFHDWHPDLVLSSKNNFLTIKNNTIWKHNDVCNSYCNFYGIDYPFQIDFPIITGQTVTTLRSIEYVLECYSRKDNCVDQFHVLDYNFDEAVVYNTEQTSGVLNLTLYPKNNVALSLLYPRLAPNNSSFDILFSKEENKYRFNQFWDITRDRGEFPQGAGYPPSGPLVPGTTTLLGNYSNESIWETSPNGYVKVLNPNNLDYAKNSLEHKKFRHYVNFLSLSKRVSGNVNMILKLSNSKNHLSIR